MSTSGRDCFCLQVPVLSSGHERLLQSLHGSCHESLTKGPRVCFMLQSENVCPDWLAVSSSRRLSTG